jgi:alkanesulfonate monooxygenase SsuD/methylene tetrahydromethanopterin reductase-like flavin-dependent oxidoreductase (luciferase family)
MADYGRPIEFGLSVTPEASRWGRWAALVEHADRLGLDLVGIQDHPYQRRFLDTWALLAALVPRTSRVRLFPDVANLPLRPPAVMANAAASLDVLSDGRFELGLGAGGFWDAIAAMGGPRRTPGESVDALAEAIEVIRLCWSEQRSVRFEGEHYRLDGYHPGPPPAHGIGIWLGAYAPRMLALTGRAADGWVPSHGYLGPEALPDAAARIDEAAAAAGRDPALIRRVYNVSGLIGDAGAGEGGLEGPAEHWAQTLTGFAIELGMDSFVFWPGEPDPGQVELFAGEVAPAVRAAVERARVSR